MIFQLSKNPLKSKRKLSNFQFHVPVDYVAKKIEDKNHVVGLFLAVKLPDCNVMNTYQKYKGKLEKIRELNPRCNIFVCPVLPSRSQKINEKIFQFNGLLFDDLVKSSININLVRGLGEFLDRGNLLKNTLHDQRTNEDVLHINDHGYRILVKCIKHTIFSSKSNASSSGRTYASVTNPS